MMKIMKLLSNFLSKNKPKEYSFLAKLEKFNNLPVMVTINTRGKIKIEYNPCSFKYKEIFEEVNRIINS